MNGAGTIIGGNSLIGTHQHATIWHTDGTAVDVGELPFASDSIVISMSGPGDVVGGVSYTSTLARGYRWTAADGFEDIGVLIGGTSTDAARVSGDGDTIVGSSESLNGRVAMMWTREAGMIEVREHPVGLGIDMDGWTLTEVNGVSTDGRVVAGIGLHDGRYEWWVAVVPGALVPIAGLFASWYLSARRIRDRRLVKSFLR
jgi:hypothetical protein